MLTLHPLQTALDLLHQNDRPTELTSMSLFGIAGEGRLGLSVPSMRGIARMLGRDHALAHALWDTAIPDARIVASMVAEPALLTSREMDAWVQGRRLGQPQGGIRAPCRICIAGHAGRA